MPPGLGGQIMDIGWAELTISPNDEAVAGLKREWAWLVPEPWHALMFSVFGDAFLERKPEGVFWLNTGTGEVTRIADDVEQFRAALATDLATDWFLPPLVARLYEAGKIPSAGECYSYAIFPVFAEGTYDI